MDYSKINIILSNLEIDKEAEYEKRKNQIINRDFNFFKEKQTKINPEDNRLSVSELNNNSDNIRNKQPENIVDLKSDINNRLNTREFIPSTGHLNIHGNNAPIIDRFPKSSKYMPNPQ
jgi:hypothetical protein